MALAPSGELWLYHGVVDLRKSYLSLCVVVESELKKEPRSGDGFIFVNRQKSLAKVLWWDRTGWCLLTKRLSAARYRVSGKSFVSSLEINKKRYFFDGL